MSTRLCQLLYGSETDRLTGGSDAQMLHDAADLIESLKEYMSGLAGVTVDQAFVDHLRLERAERCERAVVDKLHDLGVKADLAEGNLNKLLKAANDVLDEHAVDSQLWGSAPGEDLVSLAGLAATVMEIDDG